MNRTTANGLGGNSINDVYAVDSYVYVAAGRVGVSTDGGDSYTNLTTANGLGNDGVGGVFVAGATVYAGTLGGLSFGDDANLNVAVTPLPGLPVWGCVLLGLILCFIALLYMAHLP